MSGVMPPPLHYIVECIGTTLFYEVNTKAVFHFTENGKVQRNTATVVMCCKCH